MRRVRQESLVSLERHLVVAREVVQLGQHSARFGFDDGLVDVVAGKGLDRLPRFPERYGQEFGSAVDFSAQNPGAAMAGQILERRKDGSGQMPEITIRFSSCRRLSPP